MACQRKVKESDSTWYTGQPLGKKMLCLDLMMKRISKKADLSQALQEVTGKSNGNRPPIENEWHIQLGTVKLSRRRHWLNFIKTNGTAPHAAKSALHWQLHQLWKNFELHERSELDELAHAVMIGRV